MPALADIAIFPLGSVLFPGGVLPLRVFEARYMDMVRDCMQHGAPFGVCLITRGREVGEAAEHEPVGCLATITDWDMQQLGLLQIRTRGGMRFRVLERRVQKDGLVRADLEPIEDDPRVEVPEPFADCARLVRRIVDDLVAREPDPLNRMVAEPYDFASAGWVANRLCEFLPIPARARQKLMELPDPLARLSLVHQYLQQHRVL
ncbi:MAG TPA: LON peptidase substrate-binding domain-containing protein [Quisquiliibacterium sp.]|nr:LON peptidase substrate-binding domain-containing protein [Quisquiliibacterium sp.]HPA88574.1 LON peptidase substrate-binding domain-containing protein [Quisquiliibacterium sp.]HQD81587.1 LON peptidase substrate-binding domain-containing protein [Quisquiliibacterium sp.]HQN10848.1 LON peptidase substrate-binding domain-containing protein [Quisquiliibacterium sp.]HQP67513.1 LON peptidase substrate-binding domain-containing protein [Quisquiliibacterium sp.]